MGPMGPMGPVGPRGLQGEAGPAGGIILPAYTLNNVTTDRVLDADSTSIDEVVDVLGTLIADIQSGVGTGGGGGDLDIFTATVDGLVPASGGGTANYLRADGTWTAPAGRWRRRRLYSGLRPNQRYHRPHHGCGSRDHRRDG